MYLAKQESSYLNSSFIFSHESFAKPKINSKQTENFKFIVSPPTSRSSQPQMNARRKKNFEHKVASQIRKVASCFFISSSVKLVSSFSMKFLERKNSLEQLVKELY